MSADGKVQQRAGAAASTRATVEAVGVSRFYGEVLGINDVSFTLEPGITGLLGPNGAGKSTLLKLIAGQLRPSRGEVRLLGTRVDHDRSVLRRLGYCPEHEGVHEELSALEFVTAMTELHCLGPDESRARAERALADVDLVDAMHRRLGEYSKGMRQRAKIAQALAHEPEVVLLDEPLTGCDPLARARVLEVIRALGEQGRTVLLSSHVLHEIEAVTRRILVVHAGSIAAQGEVSAIRDLIDKHPHRIRVACDDPRRLARALVEGEDVASIAFAPDEPGVIVIETRAPDTCYPRIAAVARAAGVRIEALTSLDDDMAAVFRYLTERGASR